MVVNDDLRVGFAFIPRTASRSLRRTLTKKFHFRRVKGDHHRMEKGEKTKGYQWYVVVRNPFAREWSHYCYRLKNDPSSALKQLVCNMSFSEYVEAHVADDRRWKDITQSEFVDRVAPCAVLLFENLQEELERLPWWTDGVTLPHTNAASKGAWQDAYDEKTANLVHSWAFEDFKRFGYPHKPNSNTPRGIIHT